jgi:carbon storage regulator
MLILSRKTGESVIIDGRIVVTVTRVDGDVVRLGIQAPHDVPVHRREIYEEIQRNNQQAATKRRQALPKLQALARPQPKAPNPSPILSHEPSS